MLLTDRLPDSCLDLKCPPSAAVCQGSSGGPEQQEWAMSSRACVATLYLVVKASQHLQGSLLTAALPEDAGCVQPELSKALTCAQAASCGDVEGCNADCYRAACTYLDADSGLNKTAAEYCLPFYEDPASYCQGVFHFNMSTRQFVTRSHCGGKEKTHLIPTSIDEAKNLTLLELLVMSAVVLSGLCLCAGLWYRRHLNVTGEPPFEIPRTVADWLGRDQAPPELHPRP